MPSPTLAADFASAFALLAALSLLVTFAAAASVFAVLRRKISPRRPDSELPPISVLKPLCGLDEGLFENLAALARQDYPRFELILGCEDPADPALRIAEELRLAFPEVSIRIVSSATRFGWNPKVTNLASLSSHARHELHLISDSNVRPDPTYLRALAAEMEDPAVGLVGSVLAGVGATSFGARLENLQWNSFVASAVSGADILSRLTRQPIMVGKSMLFRNSDLHRLGGLAGVKDVLAEDYEIGRRFAAAGFRVALSPHAVAVRHERRSVAAFAERHLRWAAMRRSLSPFAYLGEALLLPTPWLFAAGTAGLAASRPGIAIGATAGLAARIAFDLVLSRTLARRASDPPRVVELADLAAVPAKDCAALAFWLAGWFRNIVSWRGHRLRIGRGSRLTPVETMIPDRQLFPRPSP
ncbi:MAG: glycosyltransferase [Acidobacteriota bacterium]